MDDGVRGLAGAIVVLSATAAAGCQPRESPSTQETTSALSAGTRPVPYEDARAILGRLGGPAAAPVATEAAWSAWLADHDRAVRARVDRGNEDSLYYFWLYGTSFTAHPPTTPIVLTTLAS